MPLSLDRGLLLLLLLLVECVRKNALRTRAKEGRINGNWYMGRTQICTEKFGIIERAVPMAVTTAATSTWWLECAEAGNFLGATGNWNVMVIWGKTPL